jgi:thiopeptide-type bacteriocin biosynthesis protein
MNQDPSDQRPAGNRVQGRRRRSPRPVESLYQPLGWGLVRGPLLPVEDYLALGKTAAERSEPLASAVSQDPRLRRAIAVGSLDLLAALERPSADGRAAARREAKLLRYLIRMSTRPTPYGLFAGVALARWGPVTDLGFGTDPRVRARPDMAWLLSLVMALEARPEVRRELSLLANPAAWVRTGRVFLAEQAPTVDRAGWGPAVSVRATRAVRRVLALALTPVPYRRLVAELLSLPGASPAKVEALVEQLCQQTILLTDLRPPLTVPSPARYVAARLAQIPAAYDVAAGLERLLAAMEDFGALPAEDGTTAYLGLVRMAEALHPSPTSPPVQVDMALSLAGSRISGAVAAETARAAELLVRLSPSTAGPAYLHAYRRAFESRYGHNRQVPLLELLDPSFGLGPPSLHAHGGWGAAGVDPQRSLLRQQTLRDLALAAIRDRRLVVELDERTISRLETAPPQPATAPISVDVAVFVLAASRQAVDAGDFKLVIGPNLGASAAGRNLGRFADLLGSEAEAALGEAAHAETAHAPDRLWVEVVYLPHRYRSANVAIRPLVRDHEIALGTTAGGPSARLIPLNELSVGIRDGRFRVWWTSRDAEVITCAGHMLNNANAPAVVRFLEDVVRDGTAQFSGFDWGPAAGLPYLPRVQAGRTILAPAQWLIGASTRDDELPAGTPADFHQALTKWRDRWQVPRHVYLTMGDNRLLLDLEDDAQVEQLRIEVRRLDQGSVVLLEEALPGPEHAWVPGPKGRFVTELVVPLVLRGAPTRPATPRRTIAMGAEAAHNRLRPPGSDWLYLKLYHPRPLEEDVIAGPMREFCDFAGSAGLAEEWFFLRYADPDPHLRLRFRGDPDNLIRRLVPEVCSWASELIADGLCQRFGFDTYEKELERYGGAAGTAATESVFAADSRAVASLLDLATRRVLTMDRTTLAVLTIDDLLAGLGLGAPERLVWYREQVSSRRDAGQEFRRRQGVLRPLLGDPAQLATEPGGAAIKHILDERRTALAPVGEHLQVLAERGELTQEPETIYSSYVHLHCNRLLGSATPLEQLVLGVLLRVREGLERSPLVHSRPS